MEYFISFFEGIITFISPCLLPMLPVYLLYFAGGRADGNIKKTVRNALGFVLGFTILFVALGAFAGTLGGLLNRYKTVVNLVTGGIVILFGLNYTGLLRIGFLNKTRKMQADVKPLGFFPAVLFGFVFAIGWTPCVGAFLGSALMLAAERGTLVKGILLLLSYSLGLGVPFVLSAALLNRLKGAFDFIKKHYKVINIVCGCLLIVVGVLLATGLMSRLLAAIGS